MELKNIKPEPSRGSSWPGKHVAYWLQMGHWSLEAWRDGRVRIWVSCYRPGMTETSHSHITATCPHWARIVEWCESIWCHKMQPVDQAYCRQIAAEARDARRAWLKEMRLLAAKFRTKGVRTCAQRGQ